MVCLLEEMVSLFLVEWIVLIEVGLLVYLVEGVVFGIEVALEAYLAREVVLVFEMGTWTCFAGEVVFLTEVGFWACLVLGKFGYLVGGCFYFVTKWIVASPWVGTFSEAPASRLRV